MGLLLRIHPWPRRARQSTRGRSTGERRWRDEGARDRRQPRDRAGRGRRGCDGGPASRQRADGRHAIREEELHFNGITKLNNGDLFIAGEQGTLAISSDAGATWSKLTSGLQTNFSVMLAVTDQQAQKLLFTVTQTGIPSSANGSGWSLQLRPVVHADDSPESVTTLDSVLKDGLSPAQLRKYRGVFGGGQ